MVGKKKAGKKLVGIEIKRARKDKDDGKKVPVDIFSEVATNSPADESVWLKYNFENVTTQKPPEAEKAAEEVVEDGEINNNEKEPVKDGDCDINDNGASKSQEKEYCNLDEFRGHEIVPEEVMPMTPPRILNIEELESSSDSDLSDQPLEDFDWDKNNFVIVVDKITTKAMCYATINKLNVFAIIINDCNQQFLVKVEKLNSKSDVLIRAGKIHFRDSSGITVEDIEKEDGHYRRCRYKIVANFQEIKDEFDKGKINLNMLPLTARDENNMNPSFISRKSFNHKAKLYKNCKILPFTIAKKLINQYSKKTHVGHIKIEPIAENEESQNQTMGLLCELDNIETKEELKEKEKEKKLLKKRKEPKTKRAYNRKKPAWNAKKSQSNDNSISNADKNENPKLKATDKKVELTGDTLLEEINNNQVENEIEVETTTSQEKENNKVVVKPGPKSKRQMQTRRLGSRPGRPSRKQGKKDDIEIDMVKIESEMAELFQEEAEMESSPPVSKRISKRREHKQ